jgi:hypothetical protein
MHLVELHIFSFRNKVEVQQYCKQQCFRMDPDPDPYQNVTMLIFRNKVEMQQNCKEKRSRSGSGSVPKSHGSVTLQ